MLDDNDEMVAAIEAGVQEADRGDVLDLDDVKAELAAKIGALELREETAGRPIAADLTPPPSPNKMRPDGGRR